MNLPGYAIRIILVILFFTAVGARFASTRRSTYPYFKGVSAMNYRDAILKAEGRDLDLPTKKSNWPQGYQPARVHAAGLQLMTGYAFRLAKYLSEIDARKFCRRFVVLFFALAVFFVYAVTANLWGSSTAGLFAAFIVAVFPPLIEVTNGRTFLQLPFALVFAALHLLLLQKFAAGWSRRYSLFAAVSAFFLLAIWDVAVYYVVVVVLAAALFSPLPVEHKRWIAAGHFAVFVLAALTLPHLQAQRAAFSWQAAFLASSCLYTFFTGRFPGTLRASAFVFVVGAAVTLALTPLRAGAEECLPGLKYVFYRIRFLLGKPYDPQMLPEVIRHMWSSEHAHPTGHAVLNFFTPLFFFVPAIVLAGREMWSQTDTETHPRWRLVIGAGAAVTGCAMFLVDRGAVALAAVAVVPTLGLGLKALDAGSKSRGPLLAVGTFLILVQLFSPLGSTNPAFQIAKGAGIAHQDKSKFLWVSLENTDREMIRFVASRTSVSNPFLGQPDVTAVLLTFSGRTSVLLAGAYSDFHARKHVELTRHLYGDEESLYAVCKEQGIRYVVYSIDYLLDASAYGPAYLAGLDIVPDDCLAVSMHFFPESLTHFNLVYENPHYRLFKVTDEFEPVFITDHPPVYQREILEQNGDTYESFNDRIIELMLAYSSAEASIAAGNHDAALRKLQWCLAQAPRYTLARIALGSTLLQTGKKEEARQVLMSVLSYAPDNQLALYYAAFALVQLGEHDEARGLLGILYDITNDQELLRKARLLESYIGQNIPPPATELDPDAQ